MSLLATAKLPARWLKPAEMGHTGHLLCILFLWPLTTLQWQKCKRLHKQICRLIVSTQIFQFWFFFFLDKTQQRHHRVYQPQHHIGVLLPTMLIVAGIINAQRQIKVPSMRHALNSQGHISDVPSASQFISRHFNHLSLGSWDLYTKPKTLT